MTRVREEWADWNGRGLETPRLFHVSAKFDPYAPIPAPAPYPPYSCMVVWRSVVVDELRDWLKARRWSA